MIAVSPPDGTHPNLKLVFWYWARLKETLGRLPTFDEFSHKNFAKSFPYMITTERWQEEDGRVRHLIDHMGQGIVFAGKGDTKKDPGDVFANMSNSCELALETGEPQYGCGRLWGAHSGKAVNCQRMLFPLNDSSLRPNIVYTVISPIEPIPL